MAAWASVGEAFPGTGKKWGVAVVHQKNYTRLSSSLTDDFTPKADGKFSSKHWNALDSLSSCSLGVLVFMLHCDI